MRTYMGVCVIFIYTYIHTQTFFWWYDYVLSAYFEHELLFHGLSCEHDRRNVSVISQDLEFWADWSWLRLI